jgi:hypothetical protein
VLEFTPDSRWLVSLAPTPATLGSDRDVLLHPHVGPASFGEARILDTALVNVTSVVFAPDGSGMVLTAAGGLRVYSLDADPPALLGVVEASSPKFSPDGRWLALAKPGEMVVLDWKSGDLSGRTVNGPNPDPSSVSAWRCQWVGSDTALLVGHGAEERTDGLYLLRRVEGAFEVELLLSATQGDIALIERSTFPEY